MYGHNGTTYAERTACSIQSTSARSGGPTLEVVELQRRGRFVIVFLFLTTSKKASVQRRRRDTSGWRPRASERDPPGKNPFVTPTAPLSASRQPSSRPPCVFHGRLAESCARREGRRQRREIHRTVLCLRAPLSGSRGRGMRTVLWISP